ncbi:hypothetical protein [Actinomyces slackii]|nr:hypothetical protein [Actinomyces slackii]
MSTSARATQHSITVVGGPTAVIDLAGSSAALRPPRCWESAPPG